MNSIFNQLSCVLEGNYHPLQFIITDESTDYPVFTTDEKGCTMTYIVPGVKKDAVSVKLRKGWVQVREKGNPNNKVKGYDDVFLGENSDYDISNLKATMADGILTITVPFKEPQETEIRVE